MKTMLIAGVCVFAIAGSANASWENPDFRSFAKYTLACEDVYGARVSLDVVPEYNYVILNNEKGESFKFKIDRAQTSRKPVHNSFGNEVYVPYIPYMEFRDFGGKKRWLSDSSPWIQYGGHDFSYNCIVTQ